MNALKRITHGGGLAGSHPGATVSAPALGLNREGPMAVAWRRRELRQEDA